MAFSIESRVPFLDFRLVEFLLGLPEQFIYHLGVRKAILRSSLQSLVPKNILKRRDKMGFVTPEEIWLKKEKKQWFKDQIQNSMMQFPELFNTNELVDMFEDIVRDRKAFTFEPWRILCFKRWYDIFK